MIDDIKCECGGPADYVVGIGGGWGAVCESCKAAALAMPANDDGSPYMVEGDFFRLGPDGRMTPEADARIAG
jgi:hypothetical protein